MRKRLCYQQGLLSCESLTPSPTRVATPTPHEVPNRFERAFVSGFAMTRLSHYTQVFPISNLVSKTSTARVATLREFTRYVASRRLAHNLTHLAV